VQDEKNESIMVGIDVGVWYLVLGILFLCGVKDPYQEWPTTKRARVSRSMVGWNVWGMDLVGDFIKYKCYDYMCFNFYYYV